MDPAVGEAAITRPVSTATEFCGRCGSPRDAATIRFCRRCGAPMAEKAPGTIEGTARARTVRRRPPWSVGALSVVTFNAYGIGWFGSSWADLATDRVDDTMDPIGHALAMLVPFYGQLRAHAHFRAINDRLASVGSPLRVAPQVLAAATALSLLAVAAVPFAPGPLAPVGLLALSVGLLAFVVVTGQKALNVYWGLRDAAIVSEMRIAEKVVLALFGVIFALVVIVTATGINSR